MAENREWLAGDPIVESAVECDIGSASESHRAPVLMDGDKRVLQCLGAAVVMRWNTLPAKLQRELFEHASSLDDAYLDESISDLADTVQLKRQIARFLHQKGGQGSNGGATRNERSASPSSA